MASGMEDRAAGAVVVSAVGDALGSHYELGPPLGSSVPLEFGVGVFGHGAGEWTDDTSMAVPILEVLAEGESLRSSSSLARIFEEWAHWAGDAKDVGAQTRTVLNAASRPITEESARQAAEAVHVRSGRSGGNGSLMRTGPVALGYLAPGAEADLVDASRRVAQLTHWESDNEDACALWGLAIRHAILTGELDMESQIQWLQAERQERWPGLVAEALTASSPAVFHEKNGWVVAAFQGALAAVAGSDSLVEALEAAIRGGGDTDTVAAIAGSLAGAIYGASALPDEWREKVYGWPGLRAADLEDMASRAIVEGQRS